MKCKTWIGLSWKKERERWFVSADNKQSLFHRNRKNEKQRRHCYARQFFGNLQRNASGRIAIQSAECVLHGAICLAMLQEVED